MGIVSNLRRVCIRTRPPDRIRHRCIREMDDVENVIRCGRVWVIDDEEWEERTASFVLDAAFSILQWGNLSIQDREELLDNPCMPLSTAPK